MEGEQKTNPIVETYTPFTCCLCCACILRIKCVCAGEAAGRYWYINCLSCLVLEKQNTKRCNSTSFNKTVGRFFSTQFWIQRLKGQCNEAETVDMKNKLNAKCYTKQRKYHLTPKVGPLQGSTHQQLLHFDAHGLRLRPAHYDTHSPRVSGRLQRRRLEHRALMWPSFCALCVSAEACSSLTMTTGLPTHSRAKSTPPPVISTTTSWMGSLWSPGLMQSVAPNIRAFSNLAGLMSTAMILLALAALQPMMAASPTAPRPNTAHTEPAFTWRAGHKLKGSQEVKPGLTGTIKLWPH